MLVVTADDFGLAPEVNAAVETAHRTGFLSAASLMVAGAAASDAVARARRMPRLRVGLHLVLIEGRPASPPETVPDLVGADGLFRADMTRLAVEIFAHSGVRRQVAAEIAAQFEAYRATGLPLDHVNAHKHFHLHPTIARMVVAIGRRHGMTALRVPSEPASILARVEPVPRRTVGFVEAAAAAALRRKALSAGLVVPDAVFGLAWSGAMTPERIAALIARRPPGLVEIYTHPATENAFPGSAPGYRYADELAALCDPACVAAVRSAGARLGGYGDARPGAGAGATTVEGPNRAAPGLPHG